jgi:hypothetical protein
VAKIPFLVQLVQQAEGLVVRIMLHRLSSGVLVRGQLTVLVVEQEYQDKDLLVVRLQPLTQVGVAVALDQSDLWELKQLKREMAAQGKFL